MLAALLFTLAWSAAGVAEQPGQWRWEGVDRVVSVADVHGDYRSLVELLQGVDLVSEDLHWSGGESHLVMTGDVVDRGPRSRDVLELLMRLQGEAAAAGGQVHVLLGNHEVMDIVGALDYVSQAEFASYKDVEDARDRKAAYRRAIRAGAAVNGDLRRVREELAGRFPPGYFGHRRTFAADGVFGRWLLDQRILIVINDVAYVHAGLPPVLLEYEPDRIDAIAMDQLRAFAEAQQRLYELDVLGPEMGFPRQVAVAQEIVDQGDDGRSKEIVDLARQLIDNGDGLVFRRDGPLWYRGTALNPAEEERQLIDQVLAHLDASTVVLGHTPSHTGRITVRLDGEVVLADTGMLASHYSGRASAVVARDGVLYAYYSGEGASPLATRRWEIAAAAFANADEIEEFLRTAPVVSITEVGSGRTRPQRVALSEDGRRLEAIFKTVDYGDAKCRVNGSEHPCTDSFRHEVAAYRIDRMLGLGMVPPTVLREIDGRLGSVQLWVEGAVNEANRSAEDLRPADPPAYAAQLDRADVFDTLILNSDRTETNMLITIRDWRIHLIDHSRAFVPVLARPSHLEGATLRPGAELSQRLVTLDPGALRTALDGLLSEAEVTALLARLDTLLGRS